MIYALMFRGIINCMFPRFCSETPDTAKIVYMSYVGIFRMDFSTDTNEFDCAAPLIVAPNRCAV